MMNSQCIEQNLESSVITDLSKVLNKMLKYTYWITIEDSKVEMRNLSKEQLLKKHISGQVWI